MGVDIMKSRVCNIMQQGSKAFLLHLARPEQVPEFVAHGYTFRGHQLKIEAVKATTVVVIDRVPYGLPQEAIKAVLNKYGIISGLKAITHKGYGMSKMRVEIELKQDIPSRVTVQGNPINVFYKNQPRSCFVCREGGHEARNCPRKAGPARPPNPADKTGTPSFADIAAGVKPVETIAINTDPPLTEDPCPTDDQSAPAVKVPATTTSDASETVSLSESSPALPIPPVVADPPAILSTTSETIKSVHVPPAGKVTPSLAVDPTESIAMDTHPPPVHEDPKSSSTEVTKFDLPSTQELFQKFDNTPPSLKPRPGDTSELSDSAPSATEGDKLQKKRVSKGLLHQKSMYKAPQVQSMHGSGRTRTTPIPPPTTGQKKTTTVNRFAPLADIDDQDH